MEISSPNENGLYPDQVREVVARRKRFFAAINIALCEDWLYRVGVELSYSYRGFASPIYADSEGYETLAAAKTAGIQELMRRWHRPFPSDPQSVHEELADLRAQVETQLQQPSLF